MTYQEIVQELLAIHKGHTVSNEAYEALAQVVIDQAKRIEELEEQLKRIYSPATIVPKSISFL